VENTINTYSVRFREVDISLLKKGIWIYFYLLIFEGALRKWVLPSLAEPILIIRDPLAIGLLYIAVRDGIWKPNSMVVLMFGVSILAFIFALLFGHGNLFVALFGLRITIIQFPLLFLIGRVFNNDDVIKIGKVILWINIFMTLLVAVQFYSPQSAWVNKSIGLATEGSGFQGAAGFFRVPGTFSFTNGLSLFYGFSAAFIFYFWTNVKKAGKSKTILVISTVALFAAIPLSVSRTVMFEVSLSILFLITVSVKRPKILSKVVSGFIGGIFVFLFLSLFSFFQTAVMAFTERFTSASETEGGLEGTLIDRFLGGMYGAIVQSDNIFYGVGLGMGTNAGAKIATGNTGFLISEGEWGRLIGEMGLLIGMIVIIIRINLVLKLFKLSWREISFGNLLPWLLFSFTMLNILQGQWAQPTALGFSVLSAGLVLASQNKKATAS